MLKKVLTENSAAPDFKRQAGLLKTDEFSAKTGSGMVADLWFFALDSKTVIGVWVGLPDNESTSISTEISPAAKPHPQSPPNFSNNPEIKIFFNAKKIFAKYKNYDTKDAHQISFNKNFPEGSRLSTAIMVSTIKIFTR